jgi:TIR domain
MRARPEKPTEPLTTALSRSIGRKTSSDKDVYRYDLCLSFAGEDQSYVRAVADNLTSQGVRVFYDEYQKSELWGKDLYSHLDDIYQNEARFCVIFLSEHYAKRVWTDHERRSAQARALREQAEYILPARFDDTVVPGIRDTIGYIDLRENSSNELCKLILQKLGSRPRSEYFPPVPDRLFKRLGARSQKAKDVVSFVGRQFFEALTRMNDTERQLVYNCFVHCCPAELPENVHINIDLLRRVSEMPVSKIKRTLAGISSLGFDCYLREHHDDEVNIGELQPILVLEWHERSIEMGGNYTGLAGEIIGCATEGYCEQCGREALRRLDFCQLASSTADIDQHS